MTLSNRGSAALLTLAAFAGGLAPRHARASLTFQPSTPGNVFLSTEKTRLPVTASSGDRIDWSITDYFGRRVKTGSTRVSSRQAVIDPGSSALGYFDVHVTEKRGNSTVASADTAFAVLTPVDVRSMGASPFGAQTHLAQYNDPALLGLLARAGIAHFRDEHYWSAVETKRGAYHLPAQLTRFMGAAASEHLQPLLTLDWANPLYDYRDGMFTAPFTDGGRRAFANYAAYLVDHYGSQIKWLEVWNEYNAGTFVDGPATANKPWYYARMLREVSDRVKAKRRDVKILAGGTVPIAHGFLRDVFAQGVMSKLDVVSIHPYRASPYGVDVEIEELRDLIRRYNGGHDKPIWASEFSRTVENASEQYEAASYLAQIVTLMLGARVERMYYYLTSDDRNFPWRGLVASDHSPKGAYTPHPVFVAYANLIRQLYGATFRDRVGGLSASTRAYRFTRGSDTIHVLWSARPVTVKLAAKSALEVTDLMGGTRRLSPSGGYVRLQLTPDAVYIRGTVASIRESGNRLLAYSVSDYDRSQGAGRWSYGYALGNVSYRAGLFVPMRWDVWGEDNVRWTGLGTYHYIDVDRMHPSSAMAIRRWTSPVAATVTLSGRLARESAGGDGVDVVIYVDGRQVWRRHLAPGPNPSTTASPV